MEFSFVLFYSHNLRVALPGVLTGTFPPLGGGWVECRYLFEGIGGVMSFLWPSGERYEMEMEMEI